MEDQFGTKVNLVLGIPTNGRAVAFRWAMAMATQTWPLNASIMHLVVMNKPTAEARNFIVEEALKAGSKYLWFVDDDTAPPPDASRKLIYELEQDENAMVCGGIYCEKREPVCPIVYQEANNGCFWDWKVGEVFPLQRSGFIGTGCMMIKTEVFQFLEKPYFRTIDEALPGTDEIGSRARQITDDAYFCFKILRQGFKILAHGGVLCGHHDIYTGKEYVLPSSSLPYKQQEQLIIAGGQ